jgi:hypothetical protein
LRENGEVSCRFAVKSRNELMVVGEVASKIGWISGRKIEGSNEMRAGTLRKGDVEARVWASQRRVLCSLVAPLHLADRQQRGN